MLHPLRMSSYSFVHLGPDMPLRSPCDTREHYHTSTESLSTSPQYFLLLRIPFLNSSMNAASHRHKRFVPIWPVRYRLCTWRQCLKFTERCLLPSIEWTQNNGDNRNLSSIMPLYCTYHFFIVAIIRGHKIRANKQKNNLSITQM